jgi:hypothetical protein
MGHTVFPEVMSLSITVGLQDKAAEIAQVVWHISEKRDKEGMTISHLLLDDTFTISNHHDSIVQADQ